MSISSSINEMMAAVESLGGYARTYLFSAVVIPPQSLMSGVLGYRNISPYFVTSTKLPAQTIEEGTTDYQGFTYKQGGTSSFESIDITFNVDRDHFIRNGFIDWMLKVHNPATGRVGLPIEYFGSVELTHKSNEHDTVIYNLIHAWPSSVGEVTLDNSSKEISTFTVTFSYEYHTIK